MPSNKHKCNPCVKNVVSQLYPDICHPKCNSSKSKVFSGSILNCVLEVGLFDPAKMYIICWTMMLSLKRHRVCKFDALMNVDKPILPQNEVEVPLTPLLCPEITQSLTKSTFKSYYLGLLTDKLKNSKKCKAYDDLGYKERKRREDDIAIEILCNIIDKKQFLKDREAYLEENNEKIATIISHVSDMVKVRLGKVLDHDIMNESDPPPTPTDDPSQTIDIISSSAINVMSNISKIDEMVSLNESISQVISETIKTVVGQMMVMITSNRSNEV